MTEVKLNGSIDLSIPVKKINPVRKQVKKEPRVSIPRVRSVDEIKQSVTTALEKVGGKYVHFDDINHTEGLLVAGVIDSIDGVVSADNICFAVVDRDRNVQYVNNNEHFSILREVPNNLSVLDYLYTRESKCIYDRVVSQMKSEGVEMFTKNYIYVPKSKMGDVKTKKANKNNKKTTKKR